MLDRQIFAPTERSTNRGVAHDNTILGQLQYLGDLTPILVQPLARGLDHNPAVIIDEGDPGFWLKIGVLLPGGLEGVLDHDIGSVESGRDISLPDRNPEKDIAIAVIVDERAIRLQGRLGGGHRRQVGIVNCHRVGTGGGGAGRCRDHQGDLVTSEPDLAVAEYRLVGFYQPEPVVGHVGGSHDGDHPLDRQGRLGRDRENAGMWALGEDDLEVEHPGPDEVGGIPGIAGHFPDRVRPGQGRANVAGRCEQFGHRTATVVAALWTASMILR